VGEHIVLRLMGHSERQRPRRADVAKYRDGAGHIAAMVMDRRGGIFYRYFNAIAPDQYTVGGEGYGPVFPDGQRGGAGHGLASRAIDDAVHIPDRMTRYHLSRPTRYALRSRIEIGYLAGDVGAHDRVADGVDCELGALGCERSFGAHGSLGHAQRRLRDHNVMPRLQQMIPALDASRPAWPCPGLGEH